MVCVIDTKKSSSCVRGEIGFLKIGNSHNIYLKRKLHTWNGKVEGYLGLVLMKGAKKNEH